MVDIVVTIEINYAATPGLGGSVLRHFVSSPESRRQADVPAWTRNQASAAGRLVSHRPPVQRRFLSPGESERSGFLPSGSL